MRRTVIEQVERLEAAGCLLAQEPYPWDLARFGWIRWDHTSGLFRVVAASPMGTWDAAAARPPAEEVLERMEREEAGTSPRLRRERLAVLYAEVLALAGLELAIVSVLPPRGRTAELGPLALAHLRAGQVGEALHVTAEIAHAEGQGTPVGVWAECRRLLERLSDAVARLENWPPVA